MAWRVEVKEITAIIPHNNADLLEICMLGGWPCITKKGQYSVGQKVVYFPADIS